VEGLGPVAGRKDRADGHRRFGRDKIRYEATVNSGTRTAGPRVRRGVPRLEPSTGVYDHATDRRLRNTGVHGHATGRGPRHRTAQLEITVNTRSRTASCRLDHGRTGLSTTTDIHGPTAHRRLPDARARLETTTGVYDHATGRGLRHGTIRPSATADRGRGHRTARPDATIGTLSRTARRGPRHRTSQLEVALGRRRFGAQFLGRCAQFEGLVVRFP
jgi:hypothetical protein